MKKPAPAAGQAGEAVYKKACIACHSTGAAGAPKVGDDAAWKPRAEKGIDTLVVNAVSGVGTMPPKGGNTTLSDEEVRNAVLFMLEQSGGAGSPGLFMNARSEGVETPVAARRATENVRRRTRRYVERVFLAQRSRVGRIRVRSRGFMNSPGQFSWHTKTGMYP